MADPFDPAKPLAGVDAQGYLYGNFPQQQFQERSGNAILDDLRSMGLQIRDQDFFDIRRDVMGLRKYEEQIKNLNPETRVPEAWVNEEHGWELKSNFLYRIEVEGLDPNTGEAVTGFYSLRSDSVYPVGDIEADLISRMVDEVVPYDIVIQGAIVYQVLRR